MLANIHKILHLPWIFESKTWFGKVKSLQRLDKWTAIIINMCTEFWDSPKASTLFSFASYNNQRPRKLNDPPNVQRQKEQTWESKMGRSFKSISSITPWLPLDDGGIIGTEQKCERAIWGWTGLPVTIQITSCKWPLWSHSWGENITLTPLENPSAKSGMSLVLSWLSGCRGLYPRWVEDTWWPERAVHTPGAVLTGNEWFRSGASLNASWWI